MKTATEKNKEISKFLCYEYFKKGEGPLKELNSGYWFHKHENILKGNQWKTIHSPKLFWDKNLEWAFKAIEKINELPEVRKYTISNKQCSIYDQEGNFLGHAHGNTTIEAIFEAVYMATETLKTKGVTEVPEKYFKKIKFIKFND